MTRRKNYKWFIGTDISKSKLDHAVMAGQVLLYHQITDNSVSAIKEFLVSLKAVPGFSFAKSVFCMENTGVYGNHLVSVLQKNKANIVREPAVHIMKRLGILRGKNDKLDAIRIASYSYKYRENLRFMQPRRKVLEELAQLNTTRTRLVSYHKGLSVPVNEEAAFKVKKLALSAKMLSKASIQALKDDLVRVDKLIAQLISSDEELRRLFNIIVSVRDVGKVTAVHLLLTTNEFRDISDPKKFACYAGVAPFAHESGGVVYKRKVSAMANKKMKSLLHLCALQSARFCPDLKAYYLKKTVGEGKSPMAVLNAIRYKIILRIFACVHQDRHYQASYVRPGPKETAGDTLPANVIVDWI